MKRFLYSAALTALITTPVVSAAQTDLTDAPEYTTDDTIVTVGTRIGARRVEDIAAPISVLTSDDIAARNQAFAADLLRSLPGLTVNQSGPRGSLTQIRLRGAEANHVLVLIDGIDASNPNTGEFDFAGLRAEDIAKIEVLRGEQSALYGSDAIGGVINIVTKSGARDAGWSASVEAGSFDTLSGHIGSVLPIGDSGASLSVNGIASTTEGYDISIGGAGEDDGSTSQSLTLGLNGVSFGDVQLSGKLGYSNLVSAFDSDSNFDGALDDTNDELTTQRRFGNVTARFDLGVIDHALTASWSETDAANPNAGFRNDLQGSRTTLNWTGQAEIGAGVLTGLLETETEAFETFGGVGAGQNQSQDITNNAVAIDYVHKFGDVKLSASARADFNDRFDDAQTYRLGLSYTLGRNGRLYGSVGTGVKNPSMTELFGFFPAGFTGNPDLQPETSLGYNVGYSHDFNAGHISVDIFRSELSNEIRTLFFPVNTAVNSDDDSTREGVEIEGKYDLSEAIALRGSATFLNAQDTGGADEIRRPEFLASATVIWRPTDDLTFTGSVDHTGEQLDTDFSTFPSQNVTLDAYTLVGLNGRYAISDQFSLSLRGENLTDETYQEVLGFASQGRAVYFGIGADF